MRTKQTHDILSRGTIFQLPSLLLDQLCGDLVRVRPVLSKFSHPRVSLGLKKPGGETRRGPAEDIHHEYSPLGGPAKCIKAMRVDLQNGSYIEREGNVRQVSV